MTRGTPDQLADIELVGRPTTQPHHPEEHLMPDTTPTLPAEPGDQIHEWFSLSYCNYLVLHRSLMQSMPTEWQQRMVDCLHDLRSAFGHIDQPEGFKVEAASSRDISELTEAERATHGVTEDWYRGETPPDGMSEADLNEWRDTHEDPDGPRYFRDGCEVEGDEQVLIPVPDPVPHYNRGRTFIAPAPAPARLVLGTTDQQPVTAEVRCTCGGKGLTHLHAETHEPTDQQPETAPADRRARYAAAITGALPLANRAIDAVMAVADTERENDRLTLENNSRYIKRLDTEYDNLRAELEAHRLALSDALGLGTGAPWDAIRERAAELHTATADRGAVLREAGNRLWALANRTTERGAGVLWAADRLRRMADEAQQPECTASISGRCLAERQSDGACDTEASECVHRGRPADEAQQPETEAHPAERTWAAELHDPLADEWVPGTRYLVRERAVNHLEHSRKIAPTWKDGTPTQRRLVRATTTYTVVADEQPETEALCGKTIGVGLPDNPYRPCARPAGHPEAYCRDATGDHLFLAAATPAP